MAGSEKPTFDKRKLTRLKDAKAIAESDDCLASNSEEFENTLPWELFARSIGKPAAVPAAVYQRGWRKHLHEAGNPQNPVERKLHRQFFRLDLLAPWVEVLMMTNGLAGCKAIGPLAMRLNKEVRACGESLLKIDRDRDSREGVHEHTAEAYDPDAEDDQYLAEQGPLCEAAELAEKQAAESAAAATREANVLRAFAEEKAEWEALKPEYKAEFIRYEREEIAHSADRSSPQPRWPEIEGYYEFFNFIRYLAYGSFSDAEREELIETFPSLPLDSPPAADAIGAARAEPIPAAGDPPSPPTEAEPAVDASGETSLSANSTALVEASQRTWQERLALDAQEADAEMALIHASYAAEESALLAEAI